MYDLGELFYENGMIESFIYDWFTAKTNNPQIEYNYSRKHFFEGDKEAEYTLSEQLEGNKKNRFLYKFCTIESI